VLITLIYAALLLFLLIPFTIWIGEGDTATFELSAGVEWFTEEATEPATWWAYAWFGLLVIAQALLFLLSVDRKQQRMRPQRRLGMAVAAIVIAAGLLGLGAFAAIIAVVWGDDIPDWLLWPFVFAWPILAFVFYAYRAGISTRLDSLLNWLITGSVIELLIAVPCHVIIRQRDTCCAQGISAIGLSTGIAVMLLTLGPGVWFLYQKKLDAYGPRPPAVGNEPVA